jgi:Type I restriction modification DNA specificity domain.
MGSDETRTKILPIGPIPDDWEIVKLKDVTSKIGSGATPKGGRLVYLEDGINFIRSQNVYDHHFNSNGLAYITEEAAKKLDNVTLQHNDILLNITGDSIARCCMVPDNMLPGRVNQHVSFFQSFKSF